ncbi:MAG: bifunctional pyr operon transcriptional regulator/uracil phosphoribosyltransferase PyrR [Clostridia bacterium]|nr:bifunctional pyr operon transcriptional regulator/uracil phosphoribosyltransferase PyrR [Clostridia bacterium]
MKFKSEILDENVMTRAIVRIAHQVIERNETVDNLCIIGIKTRGVPFASRLASEIKKIEGKTIDVGILDITLYRDDLSLEFDNPVLNSTEINFDVNGKKVVLVDDVIYTGRTVRSAMDEIMEIGRPSVIQLAVMVDRGHRELPIRPDFVGKNVPTSQNEIIKVNFTETDGKNNVELFEK